MKKLFVILMFGILTLVTYTYFKNPPKRNQLPALPGSPNPESKTNSPSPQVIYHGARSVAKVSLTFDADMTPFMEKKLKRGEVKSYYDEKITEILEKEEVPATLFLTGLWAKNYPAQTQNFIKNPLFEIANHSYSHPGFSSPCFSLPEIDEKKKAFQFEESQKILKELTGQTPKYFRFPGGCFSKQDLELAQKYNLQVVQWDTESKDSFNNKMDEIVKNVEQKIKFGSIIVFHLNGAPNAPKTAEALPPIINNLKSRGFQFVTISDLLKSPQ